MSWKSKTDETYDPEEMTTVSVYMPISVAEKLESYAHEQKRSLSQTAAMLLAEILDAGEKP